MTVNELLWKLMKIDAGLPVYVKYNDPDYDFSPLEDVHVADIYLDPHELEEGEEHAPITVLVLNDF